MKLIDSEWSGLGCDLPYASMEREVALCLLPIPYHSHSPVLTLNESDY